MKIKILSILFLIGLFISPSFSASFTMPEYFIYNNYFIGDSGTSLTRNGAESNGWTFIEANNGYYDNSGSATYKGDYLEIYFSKTANIGARQTLSGNITGNITIYTKGTWTSSNQNAIGTCYVKAGILDNSNNEIGSATLVTINPYGSLSGSWDGNYDLNLGAGSGKKIQIYQYCSVYALNLKSNLKEIRIYNKDATTTAYNFNATNPSANYSTGAEFIQMDAYTGLDDDSISFYYVPNSADNSSSQTLSNYSFFYNTAQGDYFYNLWIPNNIMENKTIYVLNKNNNVQIIKNVSFIKISNLENFDLIYNSVLERFEINFDIPDLMTGYNYRIYQVVIRKAGESEILKQFYFNDSGWEKGTRTFDDFTAEKSITDGLIIYYNYSFADNNDDLSNPYISTEYRYKQVINSINYLTSLFSTDYYTLSINLWQIVSTSTGAEYGSWDITFNDGIRIIPKINNVNLATWSVDIINYAGETLNYIPTSYFLPYDINLSIGVNVIRVRDSNGLIKEEATITKYKLFNILNQTLLDSNFAEKCFNNGSENTCAYNNNPAHFFTRTIFTEFFNLDGSGAKIESEIYCKKNDTLTLFYSGNIECVNMEFIPAYQITAWTGENYSYYPSYLTFNAPISETTHTSLYGFLLNNSDLLALNDWDFNQQIMNFYKSENCWDRFYYIPKNTDCVLTQYYWTNLTNKESMNISFKATTSLLDDVKTNDIFFEMKSACKLNRFKTDLLGNPIPADAWDYVGYYACVINDFVISNTMTAYYLGFIVIAIIISRYLLDLFGIKK